ncbi:MAG: TAXI family TRAP transporter solute-binding subunit [Oligoflexia bacterium]|nr:TAXI family TRAP transporter solute-binding subunit [Oligoflexia bacterium]
MSRLWKNGQLWEALSFLLPFFVLQTFLLISACEKKFSESPSSPMTMGTGDITGNYFQIGDFLSKILNSNLEKYNLKLEVISTDGSTYNIDALLKKKLMLGIVQSDRQFQAYYGVGDWEKVGAQKELRSVLSLYPESITLIVSEKSEITTLRGIVGKRVNLGNPGSGQLNNSLHILNAIGLKESDFDAQHLRPLEAIREMREGKLDAFFYTVGHPSSSIKNLSMQMKIRLIPLDGKEIDSLLEKYPYYSRTMIPVTTYPLSVNNRNIPSIGVYSTILTSSKVDEETIYAFTKEFCAIIPRLKDESALYQSVSVDKLLDNLSAPIHPGALKYYREAKLFKKIPAFLESVSETKNE